MEQAATRAARESFLERAEELTPLIAVDTQDGRFVLSTLDRHVTKSLVLKSSRGEMKILRRTLAVLAAVGNPVRGGTFLNGTTLVRATSRIECPDVYRNYVNGFRVLMERVEGDHQ